MSFSRRLERAKSNPNLNKVWRLHNGEVICFSNELVLIFKKIIEMLVDMYRKEKWAGLLLERVAITSGEANVDAVVSPDIPQKKKYAQENKLICIKYETE